MRPREDIVYLPIRHGISVFAMRKDLDIPPDPWDVPRFRLARFKTSKVNLEARCRPVHESRRSVCVSPGPASVPIPEGQMTGGAADQVRAGGRGRSALALDRGS